jgi:hypothetical protein
MNRRDFIKNITITPLVIPEIITKLDNSYYSFEDYKRIEIFTIEEIEKYGFVYEPDKSKCKTGKIGTIYCDTGKNKDGTIHHSPSIFEWSGLTEKEIKEEIAFHIWYKNINSIFVKLYNYCPFSHAHNRVMFSGHTVKPKPTDEEVEKFLNIDKKKYEKYC